MVNYVLELVLCESAELTSHLFSLGITWSNTFMQRIGRVFTS